MAWLYLISSLFSTIAVVQENKGSNVDKFSKVDTVVDQAIHTANEVATHADATFSWGNYFQAIGFMCLLLAGLWGAVWLVRRYGKFNFIPSPTALPRDALRMEAQLPLGAKTGLAVIKFLDRRLLIGITEKNIILLKDTILYNERDAQGFEHLLNGAEQHDSESS